MQVLQAGQHKFILLELDTATMSAVAEQAGFEARIKETPRTMTLDLTAAQRETPLLLFDAADPANLGWFSRCQFYVDGRTGGVMQTPISVANKRDRCGRNVTYGLKVADRQGTACLVPPAWPSAHDGTGVLRDASTTSCRRSRGRASRSAAAPASSPGGAHGSRWKPQLVLC